MSKVNDGGSAFPFLRESGSQFNPLCLGDAGMTLRDYFAGQALAGMIASGDMPIMKSDVADQAYHFADAMIERRAK